MPKTNVSGLLVVPKPMRKGSVQMRRKLSKKVMVWLGVCSNGVTPLIIFYQGTVDHARYIHDVLPIALEYANRNIGKHWIFQQDGAKLHVHHLTQNWCLDNSPSVIDKDQWPPNRPDRNSMDYCIWNEFGKVIDWH